VPPEEIQPASLAPSLCEPKELSVIVEDEEPAECSRMSMRLGSQELVAVGASSHLTQASTPHQDKKATSTADESPEIDKRISTQNGSVSSSADSFHSVELDSPRAPQYSPTPPHEKDTPALPNPALPNPDSATNRSSDTQSASQPLLIRRPENLTAPLPEIPPWKPPANRSNEAVTEPLPPLPPADPSPPPTTLSIPVREPSSPKTLTHKASAGSLFPTLPGPLPPRKSTRMPREPSTGPVGSATPGAALGGKRSSWLIKAREAKAMEDTGKGMNALGVGIGGVTGTSAVTTVHQVPGALKRKSGDLFAGPTNAGEGESERRPKVARSFDADIARTTSKVKDVMKGNENEQNHPMRMGTQHQRSPQFSFPVFPQPQDPSPGAEEQLTPASEMQDRILDRLKKTVEGLGARVGKSMGKSLGGTAAATLLAEARAAAEARVVERELAFAPADLPLRDEGRPAMLPPTTRSPDHSRLSVSDLSMPNEKKLDTNKEFPKLFQAPAPSRAHTPAARVGHTSNVSTSTTPPDSPPPNRPVFTLPPIPVFNKLPPVFVPPPKVPRPASPGGEVSSKPPSTFSLPPATAAALTVQPTFVVQPRQLAALSAQSTFESVASEAVFDGCEDMPAWMPTTQDTEYSTVYDSQPVVLENQYQQLDDDDDSWPLDEKLPPGTVWPFVGDARDDSLTWSDVPSPGPDGDAPSEPPMVEALAQPYTQPYLPPSNHVVLGANGTNPDQSYEEEYLGLDESELEEMAVEQGLSTVSLVEVRHGLVVRLASAEH
jgi:hypothetical protein